MVDFNSSELFTANKGDILNIIIIGRRDELINLFQSWREKVISSAADSRNYEYKLRACLFAMFLELIEPLKRKYKVDNKAKLKALEDTVYSKEEELDSDKLTEAYIIINGFLDQLNLTKIDTKSKVNTLIVENENGAKGL